MERRRRNLDDHNAAFLPVDQPDDFEFSDAPVGTDSVEALAASGSSAESAALNAPETAGTYYYGVCVDAVEEESETRNSCSRSVQVTVSTQADEPGTEGQPNLVVGSPSVSNCGPAAGTSLQLTRSRFGGRESRRSERPYSGKRLITHRYKMNPHLRLQPNSVAISGGGAIEMLVVREFAPQSITALAAHTFACPLRPFRPTAIPHLLVGVLVLWGASLTTVPAIAQTPEGAVADSGSVITAESGLVVVPLHVYKNRKSVGGLGEQAFELVEDEVVQDIAFVDGPGGRDDPAKGRAVPIEIIVLVDVKHTVRIDLLDTRKIRDSFF